MLETASPVSLLTALDTSKDAFHLLFDYRFEDATSGGTLRVFLDSFLIDALVAMNSTSFLTHSIYIDDAKLLGRVGIDLEFEYFDATGSLLFLDNVRTAATASVSTFLVAAVPASPTLLLVAIGIGLLCWRMPWRKRTLGEKRHPKSHLTA